MMCFTGGNSSAIRRYLQSSFGIMMAYMGLVFGSRMMANRFHPRSGWHLYLIAALPTIPLLCFAYVVARYLREETDGYQRDVVIRGMLWGTAAALAVTVFADFLRAYGWSGSLPPFTPFMVFWATAALAKIVNRIADGAAADD